jgi:hypothetical protein
MKSAVRLKSVRPLVRYVDEQQAVIDAHFSTLGALPRDADDADVEVLVELDATDGFHDEGTTPLRLEEGRGAVRFEIVQPERWWPAGMGEQPLYTMTIRLVAGGCEIDSRSLTFGLTSVRRDETVGHGPALLVNGQVCRFRNVVLVDLVDEKNLLPATGGSLLIVRDHYGPELLYQAADRAGILLLQCVPIDPEARPESAVYSELDRLTAHPSLAGYFVGHLGKLSAAVAQRIRDLDPTRAVFHDLPASPAA